MKDSFTDSEAAEGWKKAYQELREGKIDRVHIEWESQDQRYMLVIAKIQSTNKSEDGK